MRGLFIKETFLEVPPFPVKAGRTGKRKPPWRIRKHIDANRFFKGFFINASNVRLLQ
jgi:hypothetical protein